MTWLRTHYHRVLAVAWIVLAIPSLLWWKDSVLWVILLSLYANFESSMAAGEARADRQRSAEILAHIKQLLGEAGGVEMEDR